MDEIWRVALHAGVIDEREFALVERRNALRNKVIRVDDFPYDLDLKAAGKLTLKADGDASVEASGNLVLKGAMVKIN